MSDWHGTDADAEKGSVEVPPMPGDYAGGAAEYDEESLADGGDDPGRVWSKVVFSGNWGGGCLQYQKKEYRDVAEREISQMGWTLFGVCPGWTARRYS